MHTAYIKIRHRFALLPSSMHSGDEQVNEGIGGMPYMIARRIGGGFGAYVRRRKQAMHKKLIKSPKPYGFGLFVGSRRRIRTLTNRVRVCRATFTQFGYILSFVLATCILYYGNTLVSRTFLRKFYFSTRGKVNPCGLTPNLVFMVYFGEEAVALVIS